MVLTEERVCETHVPREVLELLLEDPPEPAVPTTLSSKLGAAKLIKLKQIALLIKNIKPS